MTKLFDRDGVRFRYPTNWALDVSADGDEEGWGVSVESPATAFVTLALRPGAEAETVAAEALAVLIAEYPELERTPAQDRLAGRDAAGWDFDFITLDTTVTGWLRVVPAATGVLLVICQVGEYDRDPNEAVLRAVCASLAVA